MRYFTIEGAQIGIEPIYPMTANLFLRGLGKQVMAKKLDLVLCVANAHHASGKARDVCPELPVLQSTSLPPQRAQERIGRNRHPGAKRLTLRHEHQLH